MSAYKTVLVLIFAALLHGCSQTSPDLSLSADRLAAQTPREAAYLIDGEAFALRDGQTTVTMVPGAASKTVVEIFGEPVSGDLNGDGVADAAVLLLQTTGGSGSFYYAAAALNREGGFVGTEAGFIGDRIAPQRLTVRHGVVIVDYLDRRPGEAMAMSPSLEKSKYLIVRDARLEVVPLDEGEVIAAGEVVIGHEVRSFAPCGIGKTIWLVGDSPALPAVQIAYHRAMSDAPPYTPLFMVLTGQPVGPPAEGLGAGYPAGFRASQLIHTLSDTSCTSPDQASE
jgi:hypothetical protein